METATGPFQSAKPKRGKPFVSGDPRVKPGPGRPALTPAERERRRLARIANDRIVLDVAAELRRMIGPALDRLRELIDDPDPGVGLRASADVISRVNGLPVSTNIVHATSGDECRKLDAAQIAQAARHYLLQQGAALAADVEALAAPVAVDQGEAQPVEQR